MREEKKGCRVRGRPGIWFFWWGMCCYVVCRKSGWGEVMVGGDDSVRGERINNWGTGRGRKV